MKFKAIVIHYWNLNLEEIIKFPHKGMFEYSEELKMNVIDRCLENGLQIMFSANKEGIVTIQIDNGRFRQR